MNYNDDVSRGETKMKVMNSDGSWFVSSVENGVMVRKTCGYENMVCVNDCDDHTQCNHCIYDEQFGCNTCVRGYKDCSTRWIIS